MPNKDARIGPVGGRRIVSIAMQAPRGAWDFTRSRVRGGYPSAYSQSWNVDLAARQQQARRVSAQARVDTNVEQILNRLVDRDEVDVTPSDHLTTYIEWVTRAGFVSLEVGVEQFGWTFVSTSGETTGRNGSIGDHSLLTGLIAAAN